MHRFVVPSRIGITTLAVLLMMLTIGCGPDKKPAALKPGLYLVSMGSGDADNLTLRAVNTIKGSDIIFCRKEMPDQFPDLLRGKEIHDPGFGIFAIYGKSPEEARRNKRFNYEEKMEAFDEITKIIRTAVKESKAVSVLCSGDPTIYGPNMWYAEAFEDLEPEIIPGISCFNAANAALRKGVTRGVKAHSVIMTASFGREEYTGPDSIEELSRHQATMVFFTMFLDLEKVVEKLETHYPPDTPIAIVLFAGYKDKEKVVYGTLDTIVKETGGKLPFEHLIYVGDFLTKRYKSAS
ncbi:MAG: SAM-dependent methyltransferase [Thermodesulfobacteriota bacterium]|nr:SAM-dependent methyltransferase [Thermodesulfobacteriota bacterium]